METETRSAPDLRRLRDAFLCATMKGTSELANDDEIKKRAIKTENSELVTGFAIDEKSRAFSATEDPGACQMNQT